jgi:hypothetical protein
MRSILFSTVIALVPAALVACGGGGGGGGGGADGGGGGGGVTPAGPHTHYVVNKVSVPTTSDQATSLALDVGGDKSDTPDGIPDNALGHTLAALTMYFDVQTTLTAAVDEGSITLLADVQATDTTFMNDSATGFQVLLGDNPMPAPCGSNVGSDGTFDGSDAAAATECGKQFTGGMFDISPNSPANAAVAGTIVNGVFNGGPGTIDVQIALGGTTPVDLTLHNARVKASGISATGITTATIGGAVTKSDLDTKVIPAIGAQLAPLIARDCPDATAGSGSDGPPNCGCMDGSTGATIIGLFDGDGSGDVKDCMITTQELLDNGLIKSLLAPDVCSMATCTAPDSLSLGIGVTAVAGTYTVTGE